MNNAERIVLEYEKAYESIRVPRKNYEDLINKMAKDVRNYFSANEPFESKYSWVEIVNWFSTGYIYVKEDRKSIVLGFTTYHGDDDEVTLTFEELDNITKFLDKEKEVYFDSKAEKIKTDKEKRIVKLEKELDALRNS
jgi:hypothetical protein